MNFQKDESELREIIEKKEVLHEGKVVRYEKLTVTTPGGTSASRDIIRHPGGCVVVPLDDDGYTYLVRQYRVALNETTLEFPAGKLDEGEEPSVCAARELTEETGFRATSLRYITGVYPSPGYTDELLHVFMASGLVAGAAVPDEDEFIELLRLKPEELLELVLSGEIKDAKTVIGSLFLERELRVKL